MSLKPPKQKEVSPAATRISGRDRPHRDSAISRKQDILDAARSLLISEGYSNFSLRRIAAKAGVSLRTVQHHFTSKDNLMKAVLWNTVSGYDERPENYADESLDGPRIAFVRNVRSMLADTHHEQTAGFFYQLWSYAYYRAAGADVCNAVYREHVGRIAEMMKAMNPVLDASRRKTRAVVIAALIDGMMVVNGFGRMPMADVASVESEVIDIALRLSTEI